MMTTSYNKITIDDCAVALDVLLNLVMCTLISVM